MVKHIVMWKIDPSIKDKSALKEDIKSALENLKIDNIGVYKIKVFTDLEDSSTHDIMLDSEFESIESLKAYAAHPLHLEIARTKIQPYTNERACADYII